MLAQLNRTEKNHEKTASLAHLSLKNTDSSTITVSYDLTDLDRQQ